MHVKVGDVVAAEGARYFLIGTHARTHNDGDWGGRGQPTFWHMSRAYPLEQWMRYSKRYRTKVLKCIYQSLSSKNYISQNREHFGGGAEDYYNTFFYRSNKSNPISRVLNLQLGTRQTGKRRGHYPCSAEVSAARRVPWCLSSHVFISDGDNDLYVFRRKISISPAARLEPGESCTGMTPPLTAINETHQAVIN